jgi:hypothetical protein
MWNVAEAWRLAGGTVVEPRPATRAELRRVHQDRYLDLIASTAGRATSLDPDTLTSPQTHETALLAAGATLMAVERALSGDPSARRAYALVRPPGHHAEAGRAMGFCFYNNAAAAAAHALARGAARVAIVDYDVHHGNGTQWIFYDDPRVLYVSTHQFPFYPGTGAARRQGAGTGSPERPTRAGAAMGLPGLPRLVACAGVPPDLIVCRPDSTSRATRLPGCGLAAVRAAVRELPRAAGAARGVAPVTEGGSTAGSPPRRRDRRADGAAPGSGDARRRRRPRGAGRAAVPPGPRLICDAQAPA